MAIAFDNLWLLMMLVPFALVINYGVVAREEAYLERKFGDVYAATARAYDAGCSVLLMDLRVAPPAANGPRSAGKTALRGAETLESFTPRYEIS